MALHGTLVYDWKLVHLLHLVCAFQGVFYSCVLIKLWAVTKVYCVGVWASLGPSCMYILVHLYFKYYLIEYVLSTWIFSIALTSVGCTNLNLITQTWAKNQWSEIRWGFIKLIRKAKMHQGWIEFVEGWARGQDRCKLVKCKGNLQKSKLATVKLMVLERRDKLGVCFKFKRETERGTRSGQFINSLTLAYLFGRVTPGLWQFSTTVEIDAMIRAHQIKWTFNVELDNVIEVHSSFKPV